MMQIVLYALYSTVLLCFFLLFWRLVIYPRRVASYFRSQGVPSRSALPLLGEMPTIRRYANENRRLQFFPDLLKEFNSTCCLYQFGPFPTVVISDPEHIQGFFQASTTVLTRSDTTRMLFSAMLGEENILVEADAQHARDRRLISPAFHFDALRGSLTVMNKVGDKFFAQLRRDCAAEPRIEAQRMFSQVTFSVVANCSLGGLEEIPNASNAVDEGFKKAFDLILLRARLIIGIIPTLHKLPIFKKPALDRAAKQIRDIVELSIEQRRQLLKEEGEENQQRDKDLLDILLTTKDSDGKLAFTESQVLSEALTFVLAGNDTTSKLFSWFFWGVRSQPGLLERIVEEIDEFCENHPYPEQWVPSDLNGNNLPLLDAALQETLRFYPPVAGGLSRTVLKDTDLTSKAAGNIHLPAGSTVFISIWTVHRSEKNWPKPDEFHHERFLKTPNEWNSQPRHKYSFIPFSNGTYSCIGSNFALLQARLILIRLLRDFIVEAAPDQKPILVNILSLNSITGIWLNIKERNRGQGGEGKGKK